MCSNISSSSALLNENMNLSMNNEEPSQIDFVIIQEILQRSKAIAQKKTLSHLPKSKISNNLEFDIDFKIILQAYNEILAKRHIKISNDTVYYKFLLDLSVEYNKDPSRNWWKCYEKLSKKHKNTTKALLQYIKVLLCKSFIGLCKNKKSNERKRQKGKMNVIDDKKDLENTHPYALEYPNGIIKRNTSKTKRPDLNKSSMLIIDDTLVDLSSQLDNSKEISSKNSSKRDHNNNPKIGIASRSSFINESNKPNTLDHFKPKYDRQSFGEKARMTYTQNNRSSIRSISGEFGGKSIGNTTNMSMIENQMTEYQANMGLATFTKEDYDIQVYNQNKENEQNRSNSTLDSSKDPLSTNFIELSAIENKYKIMSQCFMKWVLFVDKKKKKSVEKKIMIKKALKAINFNYMTLMRKSFKSWKLYLPKAKITRKLYNTINNNYQQKMLKTYFGRYVTVYKTRISIHSNETKALNFNRKKLLCRYFNRLLRYYQQKKSKIENMTGLLLKKSIGIRFIGFLASQTYNTNIKLYSNYDKFLDTMSKMIYAPISKQNQRKLIANSLNQALKANVFKTLLSYVQNNRRIIELHGIKILNKIFAKWKDYIKKKIILKKNLFVIREQKSTKRVQIAFESLKNHMKKRLWEKIFLKKSHLNKAKSMVIHAFKTWKMIYGLTKEENHKMNAINDQKNKLILEKSMSKWKSWKTYHKQSKEKHLKAKVFKTTRSKASLFLMLKKITKHKSELRKLSQKANAQKTKKTLGKYFTQWSWEYHANTCVQNFRRYQLAKFFWDSLLDIMVYGYKINQNVLKFKQQKAKRMKYLYFQWLKEIVEELKIKKSLLDKHMKKNRLKKLKKIYKILKGNWKLKGKRRMIIDTVLNKHNQKMIWKCFHNWQYFMVKTSKLMNNKQKFVKKTTTNLKSKFFNKWSQEYKKLRKIGYLEKDSISYLKIKKIKACYMVLKNNWLKMVRKMHQANEFSHILVWKRCFFFFNYLKKKSIRNKKVSFMRNNKIFSLMETIFKHLKQKTLKNLPKRKQQSKADKFHRLHLISAVFTRLKHFTIKQLTLKSNLKLHTIKTTKKIFDFWFKKAENSRVNNQNKKRENYILRKLYFDEMRQQAMVINKLARMCQLIQNQYLWFAFKQLNQHKMLMRQVDTKLIKAISYHNMLLYKGFFMKLSYYTAYRRSESCFMYQIYQRRKEKIMRLFFEILVIKKEKHKLRRILLENYKAAKAFEKIRICFYAFVTEVTKIKKKREAYCEIVEGRKQRLLLLAFFSLKKVVEKKNPKYTYGF